MALAGVLLSTMGFAEESLLTRAAEAYGAEDYDRVINLLQDEVPADRDGDEVAREILAAAHQRRAEIHFQNARIDASLRDFDRFNQLRPDRAARNWQRGIALYYAERYQAGVAQFELHRTVNPQDVENAVWHFLCATRAPGGSVERARESLIPVKHDERTPMAEIHDLFAGTASVEEVLAAGADGGESGRFYADLYAGLYLEALGDRERSLEHIARAAVNPSADHYMGDVTRTHLLVRGEETP